MIFIYQILFLVVTYFICAIPFGLVITKFFLNQDVRESGSGNIGATNVTRIAGKKLGALTLVLDGLKGALMVILARFFFQSSSQLHLFLALVSLVAVLAHIYPIYLNFKGGKGVATALAVLMALDPAVGYLPVLLWIAVFLVFRISSLSSLLATFLPIVLSLYYGAPWSQVVLCVALFCVIAYRHQENILRLLSGQEKKM